jgi:transposase
MEKGEKGRCKMSKRRKHYTEDFKREAVRLVEESGRTQQEIAVDPGIGKSTLGKWLLHYREEDLLAGPHEDKEKELARLRRENELLRQERDLLKKATAFFAKETSR